MDTNIVRLRILSKAHGLYIVNVLAKELCRLDASRPSPRPSLGRITGDVRSQSSIRRACRTDALRNAIMYFYRVNLEVNQGSETL
jgi:hypothetical protein